MSSFCKGFIDALIGSIHTQKQHTILKICYRMLHFLLTISQDNIYTCIHIYQIFIIFYLHNYFNLYLLLKKVKLKNAKLDD